MSSDGRKSRDRKTLGNGASYLSAVAHEIRTPLSTIVALADLMERKCGSELSPTQTRYLHMMRLNGHRLSTLIDDLLDLHRSERGELQVNPREMDPAELVTETVDTIRPLIENRSQRLDVRMALDGVILRADRDRIAQVLLNVLSNASKYSAEGTSIYLRAGVLRDTLYITIRDEGTGFSESERERIFDPYFRAEPGIDAAVAGSGLGLAVSKSLVELHGGVIDIISRPSEGTEVAICLPGARGAQSPQNRKRRTGGKSRKSAREAVARAG